MKIRTIIILIISLAILSVVYYVDNMRTMEQHETDWLRQHLLPKDAAESVRSLHIRKSDLDIVIRKTRDGQWEITQPIQTAADAKVINEALLKTLSEASRYGEFGIQEEQKADFGLDESAINVTVEIQDRNPVNFIIGSDAPIPGEVYLALPDKPNTAYVTGKSLRDAFDKSLLQLRDKTMLNFEMDDLKQAEFVVDKETATLTHENAEWTISANDAKDYDADPVVIRELIGAIKNMQAVTLDNKARLDNPAPGYPDVQVVFHTNTSDEPTTIVLRAASTEDGQPFVDETSRQTPYYAFAAGSDLRYAVDKPLIDSLSSPVTALRDRHLVRLNPREVAWLQIEWSVPKEQSIAYAFIRDEDGGWSLTSDPKKPLHEIRILEYIAFLTQVRIEEFDLKSPPPVNVAGLDNPALRVTLANTDRTKTQGFEIGRHRTGIKNQYYGRRIRSSGENVPEAGELVGVEMVEAILNNLRKPSDFFIRKPLVNFELSDLGGIEVSVKQADKTATIAVALQKIGDRIAWVGQINDAKPQALPQNTVSSFITAVYGMEYLVEYPNVNEKALEKYDLVSPSNLIRIYDKQGQVIGSIEFGNPKMEQAIIVRNQDGAYYFVQLKTLQMFRQALSQVVGRLSQ